MSGDELDLVVFRIIAAAGTAKGLYAEAVQLAREGKFDQADAKLKEGEDAFLDGHRAHADLLACMEETSMNLMIVHAEDQMMAAETYRMSADDMVALLKQLKK